MGTAARTEILQQSGKDPAYKGKEHALDVPRHMRSHPYAAATTTLIYTMPIQHIPSDQTRTTKAEQPNFQQHFLFHPTREQK